MLVLEFSTEWHGAGVEGVEKLLDHGSARVAFIRMEDWKWFSCLIRPMVLSVVELLEVERATVWQVAYVVMSG